MSNGKIDIAATDEGKQAQHVAVIANYLAAEYHEILRDKRESHQLAVQKEYDPAHQPLESDLPVGAELTPWCAVHQDAHEGTPCPVISISEYVHKRLDTMDEAEMKELGIEKAVEAPPTVYDPSTGMRKESSGLWVPH